MELIVGEKNQASLKFRDDENPRAEFVKLKRDFLDQMSRGYFYPTDLTFVLSLHSLLEVFLGTSYTPRKKICLVGQY